MEIRFDDALDIYDSVIKKNCKNKRRLYNFERNKFSILNDNLNRFNSGDYTLGRYNIFLIRRPKYRIVMSLSVIDKIINHYVTMYYLIPTLDRYLDFRNIATRKGMGTDYGVRLIKRFIEKNKKYGRFYVLKLDISKYFYNIDHQILKNLIRDKFDSDVYSVLCGIIDSTNEEYVNGAINRIKAKEFAREYNREIDEIPCYEYDKGLPIGNMTSQFFAIYYLYKLDHFIVYDLGLKYYVRYMDGATV